MHSAKCKVRESALAIVAQAQCNRDFPKPTWMVDDPIAAARRLTKATGDPATSQYGLNLNWTWWAEYVPWMRGYGGDMLSADGKKCTIDGAGAIEAMDKMASLVTTQSRP